MATYNGSTNWETFTVSIRLSNDYGQHTYYTERKQELLEEHDGDQDAAIAALAAEIEQDIENGSPVKDQDNLYNDFMRSALDAVDWADVAGDFFIE